ncbi:MAG: SUMF1/EgtB/PvdO family nonheme iron enzyme, partial [Planctomycetes bacterium]|nr:SUMF1/EgtB/PvdO family nonheme iron enzyme [Planctomycetota bacterium]
TKEVLARFDAERQALAMMDHPNIARVYDAGSTEGGRPYFTMEAVEGVPITDYCSRHKLSLPERLKLFLQVCQGVEHAHHRGVIHRDIKSANVLVSCPEQEPLAKIIDFGVARATNQRLTERTIYTELGRVVGTPAYMSPEQAEMTGERIDHRTDIYSLGVLLYELLVGQVPLDLDVHSVAFEEIVRRIREDDPPTPSVRWSRLNSERTTKLAAERQSEPAALVRQLEGDLDWICMKAIEKERERRYPAAADLAEDIQRYLQDEAVLARPPSGVYRLRKFVRKNRGAVTAAGAVMLALLVGLVGTLWFAAAASENARIARQSEGEARRQEAEARRQAAENLVLADMQRLSDYNSEAEGLWPTSPESVEAMGRWLEKARRFSARLGDHQSALAELRRRATQGEESREAPAGDAAKPAGQGPGERLWKFADPEDEGRHEMLSMLAAGLAEFMDEDPSKGAISKVERRLEWAPSAPAFRARWREAVASIGDARECPRYGGLKVEPVDGLLPIGRDPGSGLWEFACLRTGRAPARGPEGRSSVSEETAIVLVLLPGGKFLMGSPESEEDRQPVEIQHEVTLSPFFLSKYEVTQAQWSKVMGNPSRATGKLFPVESVSWYDCQAFCRKAGLKLPTEAQWEYAARAGTDGPFGGTGRLDDMGWYVDNSYDEWRVRDRKIRRRWTAPTWPGQKQPNGFGLHDMHGNVAEWCEDVYDPEFYSKPEAHRKDPICTSGSEAEWVYRGGCWGNNADYCRSAFRSSIFGYLGRSLGFRPAMPSP